MMKKSLLLAVSTAVALIVLCGCYPAQTSQKIKVTPQGEGLLEIEYKTNEKYLTLLKEGKIEDELGFMYIMSISPDEFEHRVELDFMRAFEAGIYLSKYTYNKENMTVYCTGYFDRIDRAVLYYPGEAFDYEPYPGIEELEFKTYEDGAYTLIVPTGKMVDFGQFDLTDPRSEEDIGKGLARLKEWGNFRREWYFEGFTEIEQANGMDFESNKAWFIADNEAYLTDPEYAKSIYHRISPVNISFKTPSPEEKKAIAAFEKELYEAKVEATEKYLELLKKYPPEESPEDDAEENAENAEH